MRILVAGDWYSDVHEEGVYQAYEELGHTVFRFSWHQYFRRQETAYPIFAKAEAFSLKFQDKFIVGPALGAINRDFIKSVDECKPDIISLYRGTHIVRKTLRSIKTNNPACCLIAHNEDDPFTENHPYWLWRHFLASIPEYDLVLAHRQRNVEQYKKAGARNVRFLRSWYAPKRTHPITLSNDDRRNFQCDVVFAGHYEPDGRLEYLEEIVRNGFTLRLFGPGRYWDPVIRKSPYLRNLGPVQMVWGENYNKALCGARVALCFLSKLNQDTYTRRCFEIPATQTLLLSEYSAELAELFHEGVEAAFFSSKEEFIKKVRLYVENEPIRQRVAQAGYRRVVADGHDVVSRMRQVLQWTTQLNPKS